MSVTSPARPTSGPTSEGDRDRDISARTLSLIVGGVAVLSAVFMLAVTRITHPGVGSDAACYFAIADHIAAGKGLGFYLENPLVTWPPGYPSLLAAIKWVFGGRTDVIAVWTNAVLIVVMIVLVGRVLRRLVHRRWIVALGVASIALGPTAIGLAAFVQTETIFNVCVLGTLLCLLNYDGHRRTGSWAPGWLAGAVVLTWCGFLCRYPGLYVLPLMAAWLVLPRAEGARPWDLRKWRWGTAFAYLLPALVVPVAWILRNLHVSSWALGPRYKSGVGLARNVVEALQGVERFLIGTKPLPDKLAAVCVVVLLVVIAAVAIRAFRARHADRSPNAVVDALTRFAISPVGLLLLFGAGYAVILIISRSLYGFDDLDIRLLSPALISFALVSFVVVERGLIESTPAARKVGQVALVGWLAIQFGLGLALIGPLNSIVSDFGWNSPKAIKVAFSPLLNQVPKSCTTYSNNPFDLYRGGFEAQLSPRRLQYKSTEKTDELPALKRKVDAGLETCLVWVDYTNDNTFWSLDDLKQNFDLTPIGTDGKLEAYSVSAR